MLPRWHIVFGLVFSVVVWILFMKTEWYFIALVFLSSFLIDFDHYVSSALISGRVISLGESLRYHEKRNRQDESEKKRGIRRKSDFHLFHTLEFHIFVFILGFLWIGFFYIFIGMLFHSILDIISLIYGGNLYMREFLFLNWIRRL